MGWHDAGFQTRLHHFLAGCEVVWVEMIVAFGLALGVYACWDAMRTLLRGRISNDSDLLTLFDAKR